MKSLFHLNPSLSLIPALDKRAVMPMKLGILFYFQLQWDTKAISLCQPDLPTVDICVCSEIFPVRRFRGPNERWGKRNCCSVIPLVSIPEPVLVIRAGFLCLLFVHTLFRSKLVTGIISRLFKILFFLYNGGVVNFGVKKKFYAFSFSLSPPTPH